jgi:predicted nucleic acid-binding Zn ribbon protein
VQVVAVQVGAVLVEAVRVEAGWEVDEAGREVDEASQRRAHQITRIAMGIIALAIVWAVLKSLMT